MSDGPSGDRPRPDGSGDGGRPRIGRRAVLAAVGSATAGALAGCLGVSAPRASEPNASDGAPETTRRPGATPPDGVPTFAQTGLPADICSEPISDDPGIPAVVDPAFDADWSGYDYPDRYPDGLDDDAVVVVVEVESDRRAYPLSVLWHHEIVNDVVGDRPLLVTYCPLCASGVVASRVIRGEPTEFVVSGLLWQPERIQVAAAEQDGRVFGADRRDPDAGVRQQGNLVMYDRATRSYWSQIAGRAICGPLNGTTLDLVPSTVTRWDEYRRSASTPRVLLPPPHSVTVRDG